MSSDSKKACLLQAPKRYFDVVPRFLDALRAIGYFDKFYIVTDRQLAIREMQDRDCVYKLLSKDFGWSNNIISMLYCVEEDVFFMGCEDHLLVDFDKQLIDMAFHVIENGEFGCVRLTTKPEIFADFTGGAIAPINKTYKYYISLQPTIWNKKYLESIIRPDESSWQFEILASRRAKKIDPPAGVVYKTAFNYKNLIQKGVLCEGKDYVSIHS